MTTIQHCCKNTNIYTVYADSRAAGASSFQFQDSNSEGPQVSSKSACPSDISLRGDPPIAVHVTAVCAFVLVNVR